jgi:NAD(P)-dependent dehydrogenase (short-subunit alcohol dehydrogenase family)
MSNTNDVTYNGETIVITGGGAGIGRAAALRFAQGGANVVAGDVDERAAVKTATLAQEAPGRVVAVCCDVTSTTDTQRLVNTAIEEFGRLDFAFNNAGVASAGPRVGDTDIAEVERNLAVNVVGVWKCMIAELKPMVQAGRGVIVNTASATALRAAPHLAAYASTKAAVVQISRTAAREYAEDGILVHPLCPGPVRTPMLEQLPEERIADIAAGVPLKRLGTAEEIAEVVLWLCSPAASYVNGMPLYVDGGETA